MEEGGGRQSRAGGTGCGGVVASHGLQHPGGGAAGVESGGRRRKKKETRGEKKWI